VSVAKPTWADALGTKTPSRSERAAVQALPKRKEDAAVDEINKTYALVLGSGDRPAVLREGVDDEGRPLIRLMSVGGFHDWLRPMKVWVETQAGPRPLQASKLWMDSDLRRQFDGLVFVPEGDAPEGYYNLWKGFALEPNPKGSCQRYLDHVYENVCQGNDTHFVWVMGYFAQMVQRPGRKIGTALALRGPQGVGKSIVGDEVGRLLGTHYQSVASERFVTGRFNAHLANCLFLQIEEATWGGDHAAAGKIKDLITGTHQLIEYKGKEPIRVKSHLRLLITSNNEWVVPAGLEERRFLVLDVGEGRIQDGPYFQKIREEQEAGGSAALLHYLLNYDLADIPLRQVFSTPALRDQKIAGMSAELAWWMDVLMAGSLPGDRGGEARAPIPIVYEHYLQHAQRRGISRRVSSSALGIFIHKIAPGVLRQRCTIVDPSAGKSRREWCYEFPSLAKCRAEFDRMTRGPADWPDPESTWGDS
jgi:hypothetical protein